MPPEAEFKHKPTATTGLSTEKKEHRVFLNDRGEGHLYLSGL